MFKKLLIALPVAAAIAYAGASVYVQQRTADSVDQLIAMASPFATVSYDSVASTMTGELSITDVSVTLAGYDDALKIGSIGIKLPSFLDLVSLDDFGPGKDFPESFEMFVDGVLVDSRHDYMAELFRQLERETAREHGGSVPTREADPRGHCANRYGLSARDLSELDLEAVGFSLRIGLRQLVDEVAFDTTFDIEDFQTMAMTARFRGDLDAFSRGRVSRPELTGFEFISEDHSAMQRSLARCEALGVDRDVAKQVWVDYFLADLAEAGFVADERLIEPLRAGIEAEHTWFRVIGAPSGPVDLTRLNLYKPSDLPALLGVDLESR